MKIETKFEIGDQLYIIQNEKPVLKYIHSINIGINGLRYYVADTPHIFAYATLSVVKIKFSQLSRKH